MICQYGQVPPIIWVADTRNHQAKVLDLEEISN